MTDPRFLRKGVRHQPVIWGGAGRWILVAVIEIQTVTNKSIEPTPRSLHRDKISGGSMGVLVFLNFWHFSPERTQTGSSGATESEVWIDNCMKNYRAQTKRDETRITKQTNIWRSLFHDLFHPPRSPFQKFNTNSHKFRKTSTSLEFLDVGGAWVGGEGGIRGKYCSDIPWKLPLQILFNFFVVMIPVRVSCLIKLNLRQGHQGRLRQGHQGRSQCALSCLFPTNCSHI